MKSERCSVVSDSAKFSRPEYWGGKPFPSPGHLPTPGLPHCRQILYQLSHKGSPKCHHKDAYKIDAEKDFIKKNLFIWLCWVLFTEHGIFDLCCNMGDLVP